MRWLRLVRVAVLAVLVGILFAAPGRAERLDPKDVPEPLKPWTAWATSGSEPTLCPSFLGSPDTVRCAWPTRLELGLGEHGGPFEQRWHLDARAWVPLPGDETRWPLDVKEGGKKLVVITREGAPSVELGPGDHTITGSFAWDSLPDSLVVPAETGLVALTLGGVSVAEPHREEGRLFLEKTKEQTEGDGLEVLVHRKIRDDVPLLLTTRVVLNVSGKSRELVLGKSLPPGFVPLSIDSVLPARIEPDGRLRVQARPGTWTLDVVSRSAGLVSELARPKPDGPWREGEEVWVFEAVPSLRLTSVEGGRAVDPAQTSLPDAWKNLPAYAVGPDDVLRLVEKRRGDSEPEPDRFSLSRTLWLDFDGKGYTANDTISGVVHHAARLEMRAPVVLGRVAIDGKDQFITRRDPQANAGVELQQGPLNVTADSRVEGDARDIPAVGYDRDFHEVSETLNLPPGFRLFHASGADDVPETWLKSWTLLELFLVLVLSLAFGKLFGRGWGIVAGLTFTLVFPEATSAEWIWPAVLVAEALARVVPAGRARSFFAVVRLGVLVGLVLVTLPFVVEHVRAGMYPALEREYTASPELGFGMHAKGEEGVVADAVAAAPAPAEVQPMEDAKGGGGIAKDEPALPGAPPAQAQMPNRADGLTRSLASKARSGLGSSGSVDYRQFNTEYYDPNAMVQTGPGLPKWQWSSASVRFSGPVERAQRLHFYLLTPGMNLVLAFVRAALLALLFVRLLPFKNLKLPGLGPTAAALLVLGLAVSASGTAHADIPAKETLDALRERLLEKRGCIPTCAASSRMRLEVSGNVLTVRVRIEVSATTAVPLPGGASQWVPERVSVDGSDATALLRDSGGEMYLRLPEGTHDVVAAGALANRESILVALPLKPHFVEADVHGFKLEGLHEDGIADEHLQLTRVHTDATEAGGALAAGTLPPFVHVERTLLIGLNWQVATRVVRVTPPGTAVVLEVPLLEGESVTTPDVRVVGGKVLVNMAPDATETSFQSVLAEKPRVVLTAPKTAAWTEVWRLSVSPIWHSTTTGIPSTHGDAATRVPEYRPWPGETLTVELVRPAGIPGQTLTIDQSEYAVSPGLRATDATLTFEVRASRGSEHVVKLPEGAELESVTMNGASQPLRQQGRAVTLTIVPGAQTVKLGFRIPRGVTTSFTVPPIDLGTKTVNATTKVELSDSRWILFLGGPRLGPAVLFWSLLLVLLAVAWGLGAIRTVPLSRLEWMLLAIGLSQVELPLAAIVVGWLVALAYRRDHAEGRALWFDLRQLALVGWTCFALGILVYAVEQGLMGAPEMQVHGNMSSTSTLLWFEDRTGPSPASPFVLSVPILAYRAAMLAWALWLAVSLLRWLKFGWGAFATGGVWKKREPRKLADVVLAPAPGAQSSTESSAPVTPPPTSGES